MTELGTEVKSDVLIIGGGFAGLWAAIKASDNGVNDIVLVDKGYTGMTSMSKFSAGAMVCFFPEDLGRNGENYKKILKEIIKGTDGIFDPKFFRHYIRDSYKRLKDLERMGIEFQKITFKYIIKILSKGPFITIKEVLNNFVKNFSKKEKNNSGLLNEDAIKNIFQFGRQERYLRLPNRGVKYSNYLVFPKLKGTSLIGGEAIIKALLEEAKKRKVKIMNKIFITNLIKTRDGEKVAGAIGFNRVTGEFFIFKSRGVVLAASNNSFRGNYVCTQATTGSSYKLAYEIGAILRNMEFIFMNTGSPQWGFEGTGPACQAGAKFKNKYGQPFMKKYEPGYQDKADIPYLVRAMALEVKKGNGPPLYLDFSPVDEIYRKNVHDMGGWMPLNLAKLNKMKIYPLRQKNEWLPTLQNMVGGIVTDENYHSNVSGLFAVGDCQNIGVTTFNGFSSAHCYISGAEAGRSIAKYVKNDFKIEIDYEKIKAMKLKIFEPLNRKEGLNPNEAILRIQETIFPYNIMILKNEDRLKKALEKIDDIKKDFLARAYASDFHYLVNLIEVENMLFAAELFLKASLMRKESRREHYREDYPYKDDTKWLKWICIKKNIEKNEPELFTEKMTIDSSFFI
ncbi:MAG: FAD-dependent oxidoreductase [Candidatus Helarchaeota archaeon]